MKGIILAGGKGTRLSPLTDVVNKHLLPVHNKPMILYPLETLKRAGITDIMIITGGKHVGGFIEFLGDGGRFGVNLTFRAQEQAGGIAQALLLCEDFVGDDDCSVVLGDNVYSKSFVAEKSEFGCTLFLKQVDIESAKRFGCAVTENKKVVYVEEKPDKPKSSLAMTGYYIFSSKVFEIIKTLKPSARGELEITDAIDNYVELGDCGFGTVETTWHDAGTFESLHISNNFAYEEEH